MQLHNRWAARAEEVGKIIARRGINAARPTGPGAGYPTLMAIVHGVDIPVTRDGALNSALARLSIDAKNDDLDAMEAEYDAVSAGRKPEQMVSFAPPKFDECCV